MTELASCPFCGAEMLVVEDGIEHPASDTCPMDCLWLTTDHITAWNTRALPSATQAGGWMPPDIDAIENGGKRWHGEDHRVVSVRWEPYKPDGQRQMKAKGRWQEQVGSGDYWRWQNCERPAFAPLPPAPEGEAQREEARKP